MIDLVGRAQQSDGYPTRISVVALTDDGPTCGHHELYCADTSLRLQLHYQATGRRALKIMCRFVDHIASVFGPGENQKRGYPGTKR